MENTNTNHVNIYYSEEEVHDAFKNYYNEVKQYSEVHIFTKNAMPLSLYGEENNVALHSTGKLWDKLKAWMTGEAQFIQHFSQLNISKENQERYRSIIKNGGTIIVSTQNESINLPIKDSNENNVEGAVTPLPSTIPNDVNLHQTNANDLRIDYSQLDDTEISKTSNENVLNHEVDTTVFNAQSDDEPPLDTENQSATQVAEDLNAFDVNNISELDAQLDKETSTELDLQNKFNEEEETNTIENADKQKTSEELIVHSNEPSSLNDSIQPNSHEQNLYIADVSTSNPVPFANHQQYEYYEDSPNSEHLKKLSSEQEELTELTKLDNNEETFVVPTNHESASHVPDEASNYTVDILNFLNNNGTNQEDIEISIQQLQDLAQQAQQFYGFDNKQSQINELLDLVLQLSPDEAMSIFNKITNSNIPTDSAESVLDFDLLAKLGGFESDQVKNLFAVEQELENEINIESVHQNKLSEDNTAKAFEAEQLPDELSTEPTSEHNRHDSP